MAPNSFCWQRELTGALCLFLLFVAQPARSIELIQNGSFEHADGSQNPTGWDDASGDGNNRGFGDRPHPFIRNGSVEFGVPAELPPGALDPAFSGVVRPEGAGEYYGFRWGFGNGSGFRGSATQIIDLAQSSGTPYQFSAWLASRPGDQDYAVVTLDFLDVAGATGTILSSIKFEGNDQLSPFIVGSLNIDGFADPTIPATKDNWTLYRAGGEIPPGAQSASVTIRSGLDIYGYVDLVSLQVVPEPTSAVLTWLVGAVGVAWCMRRKMRSSAASARSSSLAAAT